MIKLHHLITDGWSQRLFWEELGVHFSASSKGTSSQLPKLAVQYRHFVEWQRAWLRTPAAEEQLRYWRTQLAGVTELPLRTDRPRPEMWTGRGARRLLKLSRPLASAIKSLSRAHGVTLFMTLLAAFQCLLVSLYASRRRRGRIADRQPQPDRYRASYRDVRKYDRPADRPLRRPRLRRGAAARPASNVGCLSKPGPAVRGNAASAPGVAQHRSEHTFPGDVHSAERIAESSDAFGIIGALRRGRPGYRAVRPHARARRRGRAVWVAGSNTAPISSRLPRSRAWQCICETLLKAIVANPEERISRLRLLPEVERKRVLVDWNDTQTSFPRSAAFSEQICQAREAFAECHRGVRRAGAAQLPRACASRRSTIADRLCRNGVGADVVVILLAERGVDFLAAMIAVQQVGAAFLPLDPSHPAAWLVQIIEHSRTPARARRRTAGIARLARYRYRSCGPTPESSLPS